MRGKKNSEKLNTVAAPVAEKATQKTPKTGKTSKKKVVAEKKEDKAPVAVPETAPVPAPAEAKKEAPKKEKKAAKKAVKAEKPVKVKKEKKTLVKTEKASKAAEKKAEKKEAAPKPLIKAKLGKNEMEWVKEKIGFSCSNKACNEWSGRRFNYCPFCGRKAINSQFNHIGDKGERFE